MEIVLSSIGDKNQIQNERIGFKVILDCNLKYFLVFATTGTSGGFKNISTNTYWLLPQDVRAGDKVVLYTRQGESSIVRNDDGSNTYFFYWGLNECIFRTPNDKVVIACVKNWKVSTQ